MRPDCERWADLSDRVAIEETLTQEEQSFFDAHPDDCAACAAERTWWTELATLQASERDDEGPTVVVPDRDPLSVVPETRPTRRRAVTVIAVAAAAAAAWFARPEVRPGSVATGLLPAGAAAWDAGPTTSRAGRWHAVAASGDGVGAVEAMADTRDVATGKTGHACFRHDLGVVVCAGPSTRAILHGHDAHPWVALTAGRVVVELESRDLDAAFFVQTPHGRATALGTMFAVEAGAKKAALRVTHGRVAWGDDHAKQVVAAGEALEGGAPRVLSSDEMAADRWLLRGALLWKGGPNATVRIAPPVEGCRAVVDGRRFGAEPIWLRLPAGSRELSWQRCEERATRTLQLEPGQRVVLDSDREQIDQERPSDVTPAELLVRAQAAQAQGRLQAASALYAQLGTRFPRSAEASLARLARGRLLLQRRKPEAALRAFDAYLAGGGGLGQEARLGRIQALGALGRDAERAKAVADFIARYPDAKAARALKASSSAP